MDGDILVMSGSERHRKVILEQVKMKQYTLTQAADKLMLSTRQTRRLWKRYQEQGDVGLVRKLTPPIQLS